MQTRLIETSKLRFCVMVALGLLYAAGVSLGCSSTTNSQPSHDASLSGGATQPSTGGSSGGGAGGASSAPSTGGSTDHGTGGASAAGGSASGGASVTGGSASGGASAAGGSASGGASVTGGSASGGASASSASGGASATGGSASGGVSKTGGTASGGAGAGGSKAGGSVAGGAGGSAGAAGGTGPQGGSTSAGGASGGSSAATACASRVLSLSANATGSDPDTAYAHVEVDMKTDLPTGNAARTVEFWAYIKTTDWVGEKNEIYYIGPAANATSASTFGLDFGTKPVTGTSNHATLNPFTNGLNDDTDGDLGINSSTNQWVHVAMTWDQTSLVTYVNGLPKITVKTTAAITALKTAQSTLYIGCNPTNSNCFNGEFAEFRVWNVARSAADIQANYKKPLVGDEAGLVGYWKFDDAATATSAADSVTAAGHTAHPGTLTAKAAAQNPTFTTPTSPVPLVCP